jgi:hypothetical protein
VSVTLYLRLFAPHFYPDPISPDTIPLHIPDKKSGDLKDGKKARSKGLDRRGDNPWHAACLNRLANEGIVISMREGALRISPHFYNTEEEVDELLAALP